MLFKKFKIGQIAIQAKCWQIKEVNFVIDQWNQGYKKKYSTHNEEKSVVAGIFIRTLKYKFFQFINIWLQYQKVCTVIN